MTNTIPLPQGPQKRTIIDAAYDDCGMAGYVFGRSEEEYSSALRKLNAMMYEYPFSGLGFIPPDRGDGSIEEPSGIAFKYQNAVSSMLALRLAPQMGKALSVEQRKAMSHSMSLLYADVAVPVEMTWPTKTIAGNGKFWPFLAQ